MELNSDLRIGGRHRLEMAVLDSAGKVSLGTERAIPSTKTA
jgi:hypothetical protein